MWGVNRSPEKPFICSVFGIQCLNNHEPQTTRIHEFDALIDNVPKHIDRVKQDGLPSAPSAKSHIWLAYWDSPSHFHAWWNRPEVTSFWESLPPDAGMWREILTVSPGRAQFAVTQLQPEGMGHLGPRMDLGDKTGYWGCYYDRMSAITKENRLLSPLKEAPSRPHDGKIRYGRVRIPHVPDNVCFAVEGQDLSDVTGTERDLWFDKFDGLATQWMLDLQSAGPKAGIVDTRLCYVEESGQFRDSGQKAFDVNRKVQLFYFVDMEAMEKIGKFNKGHVALRRSFLNAYGPGGQFGGSAKIRLWEETSILKATEMDCEYVGCVEGTGLMDFEDSTLS